MLKLPVIQPNSPVSPLATPSRNPSAAQWLGHGLRLVLLLTLVIGLHRQSAGRHSSRTMASPAAGMSLVQIQEFVPHAASLKPPLDSGIVEVIDASGKVIAASATTSPAADSVVGYSGPNNVGLLLTPEQTVTAALLLNSGDTRDHVALVQADRLFWQQFVGRNWGDASPAAVDGVSGATLTSLAIAEAITLRMSGKRLSLRFPETVALDEVRNLVTGAEQMVAADWNGHTAWKILDAQGKSLGVVVRTGNLVDDVEGYQGPSELLFWIDDSGVLRNARLRRSYDNEPYVGYVKQEYSFWPLFRQRSLDSLANMDIEGEKIEGVSGATMTSMAVAHTVQAAAAKLTQPAVDASSQATVARRNWNWSIPEVATLLLAVASIPWSRSRWRGQKFPRFAWQAVCFVILGLVAGNLLSLSLLAGWTRGGAPIHLAPGLTALLALAVLWPALMKQNVYCDQLCPHGILQQWLRPAARPISARSREILGATGNRWIARLLRVTSWAGILAALGWLMFDWPVGLAWIEPFDAYAWRIGLSLSLATWLASLTLSAWRPMAYCQLACPTGQVLDAVRYARRGRNSWIFEAILLAAVVVVWSM